MNSVIPFNFKTNQIRLIYLDGEPWFVAKDVAGLLGYSKPRNAISSHCKGALKQCIPTNSGIQEMSVIPERDVYRLVMRSKLPAAEEFEEWVVGEVLPAVRKTGSYQYPSNLSRIDILKLALKAEEENIHLKYLMDKNAPKVKAYDRIAYAAGSMAVTDAAKHLQLRPKELFLWLGRNKWTYRRAGCKNWLAYQAIIQKGFLEHKVTTVQLEDGSEKLAEQVRVTAKGLAELSKKFGDIKLVS